LVPSLFNYVKLTTKGAVVSQLFRDLDVGASAQLGLYAGHNGAVVPDTRWRRHCSGKTLATLPSFAALSENRTQSWTGWASIRGESQLVSVRGLNGWGLWSSAPACRAGALRDGNQDQASRPRSLPHPRRHTHPV